MTTSLLGGGLLIFLLAIVAGLWVGVLGHRQGGRDGAWWTMMVALVMISVGIVIPALTTWIVAEDFSSRMSGGSSSGTPTSPLLPALMVLSYTCLPLGSLLFSIGFALNGLKAGRTAERVRELEQVSDAMSEEITRLNAPAPRA